MSEAVSVRRLAAWLMYISIGMRVAVYLMLPAEKPMQQFHPSDLLFFSALTEHFRDYISFITLIPPGSYVINAAVFKLLGVEAALQFRAFSVLISILDIVSVMLLWRAAGTAGAGRKIRFVLLLIFSMSLIPFELWRGGMHYDHHTVFFTSAFAAAIVYWISKRESWTAVWLVSLTAALLVSQSAVNSAIAPAVILVTGISIYFNARQYSSMAVRTAIAMLLPIAALLLISAKNKSVSEDGMTSNKAGPAMMMVVQRAFNYDAGRVRDFAKQAGAPAWYIWTYDHATVADDPATGKPYTGWINLAQAFGICFFAADSARNCNFFSFDFHPLLQYLRADTGAAKLVRYPLADSTDLKDKPYRYAGYSPELTPRWIGVYGDVSKTIYAKAILSHPVAMIRACLVQCGIFSIYGPLFPYNAMQAKSNLLARSGLRTLPAPMPFSVVLVLFTLLFACAGWFALAAVFINLLLAGYFILRKRNSKPEGNKHIYFNLISIPLLFVCAVFSCLVGGENDRYFMQAAPYIMLLACLAPAQWRYIQSKFRRI